MIIVIFFSLIIIVAFLRVFIEDFSRCYWWISNRKEHPYYNKKWFEKTKFCLWVIWQSNSAKVKEGWEDICLLIPKMARRQAFFLKNKFDREFIPNNEMDESLEMDGVAMLYLNPKEKDEYINDLMKRRALAHRRTLH